MALFHPHQDNVGNTVDHAMLQGWTFPLPEHDNWSCDGTEESNKGNQFEMNTSFADEPLNPAAPAPTGCHATFGSTRGELQTSLVKGTFHNRQLP